MDGELSGLVQDLVKATKRRRRRRPSQRNLDVYRAVKIEGESQLAAAALYRVSQGRVSAICRQVAAWHRQCEADEGNDLAAQRELLQRRMERLYGDALFKLGISGESLTTSHCQIEPDGRTTRRSVVRERAFDIRWLREAKEAAMTCYELAEAAALERTCSGRGADIVEHVLAIVARLRRALRCGEAAAGLPEAIAQAIALSNAGDEGEKGALHAIAPARANCNGPAPEEEAIAASLVDVARSRTES